MCPACCGSIVAAMTETTAPPQAPPPARTLYRDPDDGKIAGVCASLARYTDTDPVLWRIVAVVLAVFGGTGLVLYAAGWLLIPKLGEDTCIADRILRREHGTSPLAIVLVLAGALIVMAGFDDGHGLAAVAVLGLVAYLVLRERQGSPVVPSYTPPAEDGATPPTTAAWVPPPPVVRPPRRRSRLGAVTLSAAAVLTGALALARTYGADELTPSRIVAAALAVVALGLVVGTWYGRARWLALIGFLLCIALAGTAVTDEDRGFLRGGLGERTWVAAQAQPTQTYRLGVGEARLDLTGLEPDGMHQVIRARVGAGHLIVVVPEDVPIRLTAKAGVGDITEFGDSLVDGDDIERTRRYGPSGDVRVEIEATVGAGQVEVRHG